MTPERWKKVSEVFAACVNEAAEARPALLSRLCGSDLALRQEVESLLVCDSRAPGFLQAGFHVGSTIPVAEDDQAGIGAGYQIGAYRLVRRLAVGGMGTVWLAERADNEFRGLAAVKLIKKGMDTEDILLRFRQERQLLAHLHHPNICRLLDGGAGMDGRPYLIMDYVEGAPITDYCDRNRLSIRDRIQLFLHVTGAVQTAHQSLVVHRDLKPGNILVNDKGIPTLLDFGIAKVLEEDSFGSSRQETIAPRRLFTPEYASPEQIRNQPITTASDIYSLGVILYELLCGRRPFQASDGTTDDLQQRILNEEPLRPSTAARRSFDAASRSAVNGEQAAILRGEAPGRLSRRLAGDLDTIVLKALRKEPSRRYSSVEQFAEDLRRYLDGRPVLARPDRFLYRARKFTRRNRAAVLSLTVVFLAISATAATMSIQSYRIATERNKAIEAEKLAEESERFIGNMLRSVEPSVARGRDISVLREMIDQAATRIETDFGDHPALQARLHHTLGEMYEVLRAFDKSEAHFRAALAIREKTFDPKSIEIAQSLHGLAGTLLKAGVRPDQSVELCRRALDICVGLYGDEGQFTALCYSNLSGALQQMGKGEEAERMGRKGLAIGRKDNSNEINLAGIINDLAGTLMGNGKAAEAAQLYREALSMWDRHRDTHVGWIGVAYVNMGICLTKLRELDAAAEACREGLRLLQEATGTPEQYWARNQLGTVYLNKGDYAAAEKIYSEALSLKEQKGYGPDGAWADLKHNVAMMQYAQGEFDKSENSLKEVLDYLTTQLGPWNQTVAIVKRNTGLAMMANHHTEEAERSFMDALDSSLRAFPVGGLSEAETFNVLGVMQLELSPRVAEDLFQRSLALYRSANDSNNMDITGPLNGLAQALIVQGRYDEAEPLAREVYDLQCRALEDDHPDWAPTYSNLGDISRGRGDFASAEQQYLQAIAIRRLRLVTGHPDTIDVMQRLVALYAQWEKPEREADARRMLADASAVDGSQLTYSSSP